MRRSLFTVAMMLAFSPLIAPSSASPVGLGESITITSADGPFAPPIGELLASNSRDLSLTYVAPEGFVLFPDPRGDTAHLHFDSEVRRDPDTGALSFLYSLKVIEENALQGREGAKADVQSFTGFATDVTAQVDADVEVRRSADGSTVTIDDPGRGIGAPPIFAVATNATAFDSNGSLTVSLIDEFGLATIDDPGTIAMQGFPVATTTLDGVFQPVAEDGGGGGGTPIPLPPAAWTGLVPFAALGGIRAFHLRGIRAIC
jgi:hypothetical protein